MTSPTFTCPSCGFVVFEEEPGSHEVCLVCGWEHDLVQWDAPHYRGGANDASLVEEQARSVERFPHGTWTVHGRHRDPWWRPLMQVEVTAGRDAVAIPKWGEPCVPYWLQSPLGFDTVLVSHDWFDGPISGVANVDGRAHAFDAIFDDATDQWSRQRIELRPLEAATVQLELEALEIWRRWSAARLGGGDVTALHPALPADRARYDVVAAELLERRASLPEPFFARPEWAWPSPPTPRRANGWLAVRWERLA